MLEDVVGCKWAVAVLGLVRRGVHRPGAMERAIEGISRKVLNERLSKLVRFGILEKSIHPEVPPRVEYRLSEFGNRFCSLTDHVEQLQGELDAVDEQRNRPY